jgi:hypothetical protein
MYVHGWPGKVRSSYDTIRVIRGWKTTFCADVNELALACGIDNRLVEEGWTTRKNAKGDTEWLPPPHLDHGQPRTTPFHHPERFLRDDDDEPV